MARGSLNAEEKQVLKLIASGHDTLCNVVDYMGWIVPEAVIVIDRLEMEGYIRRAGSFGSEYLRFVLTEKGYQVIEELPETEKEFIYKYGLSKEDVDILKAASELGRAQSDNEHLTAKTGYSGMQVVASIENLEKKGYLRQFGWVRRRVAVTPQGEKMIKAG
ncbi:MAG: hypothetical protein HPY90_10005 [Syntrophothermus sp.]|uniref:hypothetical protein n=1 Tax=Syntrophothermus sp. TaxID=2736299 RepID=UPI00257AD2B5|nr:hypothetical protein [Syntrophothermus sp.]NSW83585.1 hypothetical protein [Syntrophothermus sp.]